MKANEKHILFRNEKIAFSDNGKGRTVVLLHGFLGAKEIWKTTEEQLTKHFRVISIDLPGHGKSACYGYVHHMELLARAVKAVMDSLKLKKYILVGHSMGGYAALAFAELFPDNLKGMCLFHSTSYADSEEKKRDRTRAVRLVKADANVYTRTTIKNLFAIKNLNRHKAAIAFAQKIAARTNKRGIVSTLEGMKDRPNRDIVLNFSEYPVMMIIGRYDAILPMQSLLNQSEFVPSKYVLLLENDGHMGFLENPLICSKHMKRFFRLCFKKQGTQLDIRENEF
ncbi:MAG: alpha/beta hydrolase [Bacteroidetes bacterium]|jgi:pimeloyl-ACP methyl ester carboxylesterase|nr:alpha/beta hydrolase [Bacteroidota bacterium]